MGDIFIVLDAAAAAAVQEREADRIGADRSAWRLEPRLLEDGISSILPAGVLEAEQYAEHFDHLKGLPTKTRAELVAERLLPAPEE